MQKIGSITSTADANGEWTNGNVAAGIAPTILDAGWLNTVQRGLINIVTNGGLNIDPANDAQVLSALKKIFLQSGSNLSEIAAAGTAAQASARTNILAAALTGLSTQQFSVAAATNPANAVRLDQFQYGSNGNGVFIKFPGGMQICRLTLTILPNNSATWTYPLSFSSAPQVVAMPFPSGPLTAPIWLSATSAGSCIFSITTRLALSFMQ